MNVPPPIGAPLRPAHPAARRRLSPLEAAAAVAVIVSCLLATALMTGVLPENFQRSGASAAVTTRPQVEPARPLALPAAQDAGQPVRAFAGLPPPLPTSPTPSTRLTPATQAAEATSPAISAAAVSTATALTPGPITKRPAVDGSTASAPAAAAPHARHRRLTRTYRAQHPAGVPAQAKTRDEVMAELLRAKRDGSYSSAMEAYR